MHLAPLPGQIASKAHIKSEPPAQTAAGTSATCLEPGARGILLLHPIACLMTAVKTSRGLLQSTRGGCTRVSEQVSLMIFVSVRVDPACITANFLQVAPSSEPPDPHSHPPELGHQLRKTAARAGSSIALRDLKDIQQQLRGNALDAIVADFSVHVARDHRCVRRSASRSQSRNVTDTIPFFAIAFSTEYQSALTPKMADL